MPIVNQVIETSPDGTKERHVVVRYYDQDGKEYMQSFWLAANVDLAALVAAKVAEMNVQLADQEFEQIVGVE